MDLGRWLKGSCTEAAALPVPFDAPSGVSCNEERAGRCASVNTDSVTVDRERARQLEGRYLDRFRAEMALIRELYHPGEQRYYAAGGIRVLERDGSDVVRRLMERLGRTERGLLAAMPCDRGVRYEVLQTGLFARARVKVVVAAQVLSPLQELLAGDSTDAPIGPGVAREAFDAIVREPDAFHYVGLATTTRFAPEVVASPPAAPNALLALAEPAGATAWRLHLAEPERWKGLDFVFDPERGDEKVARCRAAIEALPDVQLRGGHILIEDLYAALAFDVAVVDAALAALTGPGGEGEWLVRDVGERRILQRARFPERKGS